MTTSIEDKAYALGIIGRELQIDFDDKLSDDQLRQIDEIAEDALLEEPKTEVGKKFKIVIEEEKKNAESEYNSSFNFNKDLNQNKISPATVFLFETLAKYAQRIVDKDPAVEGEILSELIVKMNELEYPVDYIKTPFNIVLGNVQNIQTRLDGQRTDREEEIKAYAIGVKHPKYDTLSPHIASFKQLDETIIKLRETTGFTEEDYRGK